MKKRSALRVLALTLVAILMLGIMPVMAADQWTEYKVIADTATKAPDTENFTWSSLWRVLNPSDVWTGDSYECWLNGEKVSFKFNGTGLKVNAFVNTQDVTGDGVLDSCVNNDVKISIDGGEALPLNMVAETTTIAHQDVFEITGLTAGDHTAVITCGQYSAPAISNSFYLNSVSILNGKMGHTSNWSVYKVLNSSQNPDTEKFDFSVNWRVLNPSDVWTGNSYECWLNGEKVSFKFNGTGLKVNAFVNTQDVTGDGVLDSCVNNDVKISIDGGEAMPLNMVAETHTIAHQDVFEITGLTAGDHTAVITCGQYSAPAISNSFYLNSVSVENGSVQPVVSWDEEIVAVDKNDVPSTAFAFTGVAWNIFGDGITKYMHSGAAGGVCDFAFYGTGVRLIACVNVQNGQSWNNDEVYVSLDGGEFVKADMWVEATPGTAAIVYEAKGLEEGRHTVTIENRGRESQWGAQFFFHGVQLSSGGYMLEPPQWSDIIRAVDDKGVIHPDYEYTGNWGQLSPYMRAVARGDKVTFNVDGDGFKVYAMVNVQSDGKGGWIIYNNDVAYISIDGSDPVPMEMVVEGVVADYAVYSVTGLSEGDHKVTITNGDNVIGNNEEFYFYGVSVLNGDLVDSRGEILSLEVEQMPSKLYYGENTELDLTGLKLKANGDDNYIIEPNLKSVGINLNPDGNGKYYVSTENPDTVQEIICTYKGNEFVLPIVYYSVDSIEISKLPKTEYSLSDDHFVTSGGEIAIILGGDTVEDKPVATELLKVSMITSGFPANITGGTEYEVECSYLDKDFSYNVLFISKYGDIDCDGDVDDDDLILLINYLIKEENTVVAEGGLAVAELDGVAGITMDDATVLAKALAQGKELTAPEMSLAPEVDPTEEELTANEQGVITVTQNNVRHIGRTYYNETLKGYNFNWSCSGVEFNFKGTKAQVELIGNTIFDNSTYPLIQVFVDGEDTPSKVLTLTGSKAWYTLAEGLEEGEHTVKILKQNQTAYSSALISGIKVDGQLLAPNSRKDIGIQIIGDSISAGMYNETPGLYEGPYVLKEENSYNTAYAMLARKLDADFTVFANSGAACNESAGPVRRDVQVGRNITARYRYTDLFWGYEGELGLDNTRTDLIIINLGTNDNDYIGANPVRKKAFVDSYVELLRYLRERYPNAPIVCTYGIIITSPSDLIEEAVNTVRNEDGDLNVYFHMERTLSHPGHPRVEDNEVYANELLDWLRSEGLI